MVGSNIEIRPNAVYTLSEVCQILRISDATARRWLKAGKLRAARVGRAYRVLGSQLLEALDKGVSELEAASAAPARGGRPRSSP
jgi:excisionase family DNA binding protein